MRKTISNYKSFLSAFAFFAILLFLSKDVRATHLIGGDITYRHISGTTYEFTLTLYQDCLGGSAEAIAADNPSYFAIFRNDNNQKIDEGSINASHTNIVPTGFSNECINNYPNTCMQLMRFKIVRTLPSNNVGYTFVYQRCCRNGSISNINNPGNSGVTFYATIPAFNPSDPVKYNNSAIFKNFPPQIICANNPFSFDFSATDADGDSLSYELCTAYLGGTPTSPAPGSNPNDPILPPPFQSVIYNPPYTSVTPVLGTPALTIDSISGILSGTPANVGRYVLSICVKEWRNGININKVSRDLQFVITNCSKAVVASMPQFSKQPNTYIVECRETPQVNFINTSTGGFSYFWDFGVAGIDSDTSNLMSPSYIYQDTGVYKVKLVVNRGTTCADSITKFVKVYPIFKPNFSSEGKLCKGEPISFTDSTFATFPPVTKWNWSFGDGQTSTLQNPVHIYMDNLDTHWVTLVSESQKGCLDSITKPVVIPYFNPSAGKDTTIVKGYIFNMNGSGGISYLWTPSTYLNNPTDPKTPTNFTQTGTFEYNLRITSKDNCVANDSVTINVLDKPWFMIPTGFSPNGDGLNDVLRPISAGMARLLYFKIYNRYGQQVYQSYSFNAGGWDGTYNGTKCDEGVYFWQAAAVDPFNKTIEIKGDVTLIR